MAPKTATFSKDTFQFFKDLKRNNHKNWMDANRDRYQESVVRPLKKLMEEMAPAVLKLDRRFETTGRRGANLSRINNDIRFSKDKTLYKTNMYLKFSVPISAEMESGQLYTGVSTRHGYGGVSDLWRIEKKSFAAGAGWRCADCQKSALAGAAEETARQEIRKLLVLRDQRGMDATRRLADRRRVAKVASLDRAQKAFAGCGHAWRISERTRKDLPRRFSDIEGSIAA